MMMSITLCRTAQWARAAWLFGDGGRVAFKMVEEDSSSTVVRSEKAPQFYLQFGTDEI